MVLPYLNTSYYSNKLLLLPFSLFVTFLVSYGLYVFNAKLLKILVTTFFFSTFFAADLCNQNALTDKRSDKMQHNIQTLCKSQQMISSPDIFLLTYESYVGNETMQIYGIDNSEQEYYLAEKGFNIYNGIYSIGPASTVSMNAVLAVASDENEARGATSGNGKIQRILRCNGYKTYGIFPNNYFFWEQTIDYDYSFPTAILSRQMGASTVFIKAIMQGEFVCWQIHDGFAYSEYLAQKQDALSASKQANPRFVYTHNKYPGHSRHMGRLVVENDLEKYKLGLQMANAEMKNDVETILKSNPDSIIIINGDHGPHLIQSEKDIRKIGRMNIQDRYGAFLAIKWPENLQHNESSIIVLQDIFPVVLDALFDTKDFSRLKIEPKTLLPEVVAGAAVNNGIIIGGRDDGRLLYEYSTLFAEPE